MEVRAEAIGPSRSGGKGKTGGKACRKDAPSEGGTALPPETPSRLGNPDGVNSTYLNPRPRSRAIIAALRSQVAV